MLRGMDEQVNFDTNMTDDIADEKKMADI